MHAEVRALTPGGDGPHGGHVKRGFHKGQKVTKIIHTPEGEERCDAIVHSIRKGVLYLLNKGTDGDPEEGITYDPWSGQEREGFFRSIGMWSEIVAAPGAEQ